MADQWRIVVGDCREGLRELPEKSARCCITSPPYYGLRDYGHDGQIGLEQSPDEYVAALVGVFREVRRVLADDGTLWLNLGDSYAAAGATRSTGRNDAGRPDKTRGWNEYDIQRTTVATNTGAKPKDLLGIPWRVALALQADGWYLRSDIIWHKSNAMPESVTDRPTKAHEYLFLLAKSARYFYDAAAVQEKAVKGDSGAGMRNYRPGTNGNQRKHEGQTEVPDREYRNRRTVWTIPTKPYSGAHFAVMPADLVEPCVLAGSATGDLVIDPFTGSGTVASVALEHNRSFFGTELNPAYAQLARERIAGTATRLF